MSSFEVVQNGVHESFDSSDFSMIPDQPIPQGSLQNPVNGLFDMSNMQSAFMSATQDLSLQEIQNRLVELVEDNETMKEALKNNNSMMKEQLSTIAAWHNEMTTSMSKQQMNLSEAKGRIVDLEKENLQLLEKIKEFQGKPKNVTDSETSTRDDTVVSDEESDFEIVPAKKLEGASTKKTAEEEEKLKTDRDYAKLKTSHDNLLKQVEEHQNDMKQLKASNENSCQDFEAKIRDLNERIIMTTKATDAEMLDHKETKRLFEVLQANYERVSNQLRIQSKDQREKNENVDSERELDTKQFLEQIDNLTAKLLDVEQNLEEQKEKVEELTSELDAVNGDSESIPILKAQVEVYKLEVDNAVLAKQAAREEVEQLNKQIHDLQSSASFCSNCGAGSSNSDARSKGRKKPSHWRPHESHSRQDGELIVCPVCNFGFTDLQAAENHVNGCIDKAQ